MRTEILSLGIVAAIAATPAGAGMMDRRVGEPWQQSRCRVIEEAAGANLLPVGLLTRLLWAESRLQADAVSPKGARGVAQFMPGTADERGLLDPFDPVKAIPQAARLLADLNHRFKNTGLAVAAYNAGSKRVSDWLASTAALPKETQNFVFTVTGHSPEEWVGTGKFPLPAETQSCLDLAASLPTHRINNGEGYSRSQRSANENSNRSQESSTLVSQYYIGYGTPDRWRNPRGLSSQYYIGYRNSDGSSRDGS